MRESTHRTTGALLLIGALSLGCLFLSSLFLTWDDVLAGPSPDSNVVAPGNPVAGREGFNGTGVCYYCHGVDGYIDKRPDLAADTAALIARLHPPPADLRNSKTLHLKNDRQRAKAVREGHPGTGMFPDTTMTNQELADILAYLALLRKEGSAAHQ